MARRAAALVHKKKRQGRLPTAALKVAVAQGSKGGPRTEPIRFSSIAKRREATLADSCIRPAVARVAIAGPQASVGAPSPSAAGEAVRRADVALAHCLNV